MHDATAFIGGGILFRVHKVAFCLPQSGDVLFVIEWCSHMSACLVQVLDLSASVMDTSLMSGIKL